MSSRRNASTSRAAGGAPTPSRRSTRRSTASPAPQIDPERDESPTKRAATPRKVTRSGSQAPSPHDESAAPTGLVSDRSSAYGGDTGSEFGEEKGFGANQGFLEAFDQANAGGSEDDSGSRPQVSKVGSSRRGRQKKITQALETVDEEDVPGPSQPPVVTDPGPRPESSPQRDVGDLQDQTTVLDQGNPAFRGVEVASHSAALANHVPQPGVAQDAPGASAPHAIAPPDNVNDAPRVAATPLSTFQRIKALLAVKWPIMFVIFAWLCLQAALLFPAVGDNHAALGLRTAERSVWDFTKSWMPSLPFTGSGASDDVLRRLFILETRVDTLSGMSDSTIKSLDHLKQVLPKEVALQMRDGELHVPDGFWHALKSKFDTGHQSSNTWESWLKANEASLSSWMNNAVDRKIRHSNVVTSDEFANLVASNYEALAPQINTELTKRFESLNARFDSIDVNVADKALRAVDTKYEHMLAQLPAEYLASLADANIRKATDMALRSVNFFNPLMGAVVDPYMSSPTQRSSQNALSSVYMWLKDRREFPPMTALRPWTDAGQCWCAAAPSKDRKAPDYGYPKAQLAVLMEKPVFAQQVTIEHVPRSGTLDKGSAPERMELWIKMDVETPKKMAKYRKLQRLSQDVFGPFNTEELERDRLGMPEHYVRVAIWRYIWEDSAHHVQTFPLDLDLWELGVSTKSAIVRAQSNYGADHTCLYRVRLHGKEA